MEQNPPPTWSHPELGEFSFDGSWSATVSVPAFAVFIYGPSDEDHEALKGRYTLSFEVDDKGRNPSDAASALAACVVENAPELVRTVAEALWDDFNGRGPRSGMWWRGDIEAVNKSIEPSLRKPEDLYKVMRLSEIYVRVYGAADGGPLIELCFCAAFEREHKISVLTDSVSVIGIGYQSNASLFEDVEDK